jgi:arabinose-5-phosphate isomerase
MPAPKSRPKARARTRASRVADSDLEAAREVIRAEARAVAQVADRLGPAFRKAVSLVVACRGRVVCTGIGKAGFLAQRLSAVLASIGTPSLYLHPADAVHGDMGRVARDDVMVAISNSGATEELLRLLPTIRALGVHLIALTGRPDSPLAAAAGVILDVGPVDEAGPIGMVPTASSAALHALGDALAMAVSRHRPFTHEDYARNHPGGALGRKLLKVRELMREGDANPVIGRDATLREVLLVMNARGRPGCAVVRGRDGRLAGLFTDGDLRRLLERGPIDLECPVRDVMTAGPATIDADDRVVEAAELMRTKRVDQLPVVDSRGVPIGLLDVQDLLAARFL